MEHFGDGWHRGDEKIRNSVREDNDVPIFAMTANTFATDRKRCADAGIF
jgi:CheY-like chemotaxis protein